MVKNYEFKIIQLLHLYKFEVSVQWKKNRVKYNDQFQIKFHSIIDFNNKI